MKLQVLLITLCFILISVIAHSQQKGYYSIGNNAGKLRIAGDRKPADSFVHAQKGYYNIVSNSRKLRRYIIENNVYMRRTPEITKGYYSIGRNAEKLK